MEGARSSLNGSVATAILTLLQYHDCRIADDCFKLVPFFLVQVLMFLMYFGSHFSV